MSAGSAARRGRWIPLGRAGGLRFFLDPIFVLAVALLVLLGDESASWGARALLAIVLLASVLWHELGHALAAKALGLRVSGIYLHLLPFAYVQRGTPREELRVALSGPAASLLSACALALGPDRLSLDPGSWAERPIGFALLVNAAMGLVNLVPAQPLDGGRALGALLRQRVSEEAARKIGVIVGLVVACVLVVWSFALGEHAYANLPLFLGVFVGVTAVVGVARSR